MPSQTVNAWHVSLLGMMDLAKILLALGMKYVSFGKIKSDGLEGEYGIIRQLSGGNYHISVEQVISSVSLCSMKLYHKLEIYGDEMVSTECVFCAGNLQVKNDDLELIDNCFSEGPNISESECSTVYYICGYVSFKENLITKVNLLRWYREVS